MDKDLSLNLFREALSTAQDELEAELTEKTSKVVITREQHESGVARIMAAFRKRKNIIVKRRILVALLAAVLVILTSCTIYANRDKIAAFMEKFYSTYIDVSYGEIDENVPTEIQQVYLPSYIPEGYEITDLHSNSARVRTQWENEDGARITFVQNLLAGDLTGLDFEKGDPNIITVNDMTVYYSKYNNADIYVWNDGYYSYQMTTTENFPYEELEKLMTLSATE